MRTGKYVSLLMGLMLSLSVLFAVPASANDSVALPAMPALVVDMAPALDTPAIAVHSEFRICGATGLIGSDSSTAAAAACSTAEVSHSGIASRDRLDEEVDEGAYAERFFVMREGLDLITPPS